MGLELHFEQLGFSKLLKRRDQLLVTPGRSRNFRKHALTVCKKLAQQQVTVGKPMATGGHCLLSETFSLSETFERITGIQGRDRLSLKGDLDTNGPFSMYPRGSCPCYVTLTARVTGNLRPWRHDPSAGHRVP